MSAFYVGQRVKLVRPTLAVNSGAEGVIICAGPWITGQLLPCGFTAGCVLDYGVQWDRPVCDSSTLAWDRNGYVTAGRIEPIQPTPTAADILALEGLPEGDCPLPVLVAA